MKRVLILPVALSSGKNLLTEDWRPSGYEGITTIFPDSSDDAIEAVISDPSRHVHSSEEIFQHFLDAENQEWSDEHTQDPEEPLDPATRPKKCYGVALSDATDMGPYQAGALIGLLKHQAKIGEKYQVFTGVALGALNAYIASLYDYESIDDATKELSKSINKMFTKSRGLLAFCFEDPVLQVMVWRVHLWLLLREGALRCERAE
jgi:hypothetical protein